VINTLCDMALVYGYASEQKSIDADLIKEVVRDRKKGGLFAGREEGEEPDAALREAVRRRE
jgi:hypothetical protein